MNGENNVLPKSASNGIRFVAGLSAAALFATRELNPLFVALFTVFTLIGFFLHQAPQLLKIIRKLQPFLAFGFFLISLLDFFALSRSFLLSVAHFLLALQGIRLLSFRTPRDCLGSVFVSSMMILSASTLSVEWTFFVFMVIFLPSAIWCLVQLNLVAESQIVTASQNPSLSMKEMELVRAGLSDRWFMEEANGAWVRTLPFLKKSTVVAFVVAASCCLFVFVIFPRFNFRGFRGQFLQPVQKTGFTGKVDLEKGSRVFQDTSVAMRIEINSKDRPLWPGYVRGATLNAFDGKVWSPGAIGQAHVVYPSGGKFALSQIRDNKVRILHQNIFLESMDSPALFAAAIPVSFKLDRPFVLAREDGSVERGRGDVWRLAYQTESLIPEQPYSPLLFETSFISKNIKNPDARALTQLPPLSPQIANMARVISQAGRTPLLKARLIENYLRTNYQYSLDLESYRGRNVLDKFLFEEKKGSCEYFASALCVMLRAINIPCRMTTGFYAHEWNDRGGYFVVRMSDAHAWVECFIDGEWFRLDPTPREFVQTSNQSGWLGEVKEIFDNINLRWNRYILSYDLERQVQIFQSFSEKSRRLTVNLDSASNRFGRLFGWLNFQPGIDQKNSRHIMVRMGRWLILLGICAAFFMCLKFLQSMRRKKNKVWFYGRLVRFLEKIGGHKPESQTVREFASALSDKLGNMRSEVQFIIGEYYQRRFASQHSATSDNLIKQALHRLKA